MKTPTLVTLFALTLLVSPATAQSPTKYEDHMLGRLGYGQDAWTLKRFRNKGRRAYIEEQLAHLGLMDAKTIITHCQTHHRSGLSYMLGRLLHLPVRAYHGSLSEWGNRDDLPIETGAA